MRSHTSLSRSQARRVALTAQGFSDPPPAAVGTRAFNRVMSRIAVLQIDSVNVVKRAQYMPLFSRLGPYDVELLHRAAETRPRRVFEYWGHEASYLRVDLQPALRFRMAAAAEVAWGSMRRVWAEQPDLVAAVLEEVATRGPLTAREIEHDAPRTQGHWGWNWSHVKIALEWLFYSGKVCAARRNSAFERVYDLPERVLPHSVLATATPTPAEAHRLLIRTAAIAHGVGTEQCLRDYFRLKPKPAADAVGELVEAGELLPVAIEGWTRPAYLWHAARLTRKVEACALLSPFDSLIFERGRTERLFDYRFRIEIYVPAPKRVYGYYVYSFLLGEQIVARVDLKADRQSGALLVQGAWAESGAPAETASRLWGELESLAGWLGLGDVVVGARGDFAPALRTWASAAGASRVVA
ncbi:MAG: winged helix-turn-helix domain-containing protein [Nocardioidaceae bacterium]|nr:winged helix-turn-helix domain-containing protein [Nocardioidaceae bacterium]